MIIIIIIAALIGTLGGLAIRKSIFKKRNAKILENPEAEITHLKSSPDFVSIEIPGYTVDDLYRLFSAMESQKRKIGEFPVGAVKKVNDKELLFTTPGFTGVVTATSALSSMMYFENEKLVVSSRFIKKDLGAKKSKMDDYHAVITDFILVNAKHEAAS